MTTRMNVGFAATQVFVGIVTWKPWKLHPVRLSATPARNWTQSAAWPIEAARLRGVDTTNLREELDRRTAESELPSPVTAISE